MGCYTEEVKRWMLGRENYSESILEVASNTV